MDVTWDDDDRAGVYARFVDPDNWYYLTADAKAAGDAEIDEVFDLFRRKNGFDTQLIIDTSTPVGIADGDTRTVTFRVEGNRLFGFVNGEPIPGIDPFVDPDPVVGAGTGGVGEQNNRTFFDNLSLQSLETAGPPPALVRIMGGLGSAPDTFISPLGEDCPLTSFSLEATEPLTLNAVTATYTGMEAVPNATLTDNGGGMHTVTLDPPPEPGAWLRLDLEVTGAGGGTATLTVWVAHQPLDITQDGRTNIQDATAFGAVFNTSKEPRLIDTNCDGQVNIQDATSFGANWNGGWANTALPPKP